MIVRPKKLYEWRNRGIPEVDEIPSRIGDGLFIQCEVVVPKSTEGRKVTLWIPPEWADPMLKSLRDYGIRRRAQSLKGTS